MGSLRESISGETTMREVVEKELGASVPVFDRSLGNPRERELFIALGA